MGARDPDVRDLDRCHVGPPPPDRRATLGHATTPSARRWTIWSIPATAQASRAKATLRPAEVDFPLVPRRCTTRDRRVRSGRWLIHDAERRPGVPMATLLRDARAHGGRRRDGRGSRCAAPRPGPAAPRVALPCRGLAEPAALVPAPPHHLICGDAVPTVASRAGQGPADRGGYRSGLSNRCSGDQRSPTCSSSADICVNPTQRAFRPRGRRAGQPYLRDTPTSPAPTSGSPIGFGC